MDVALGYYYSCVVCVKYNYNILNCHAILIAVIEEYISIWKKMSLIMPGPVAVSTLAVFFGQEKLSQVY